MEITNQMRSYFNSRTKYHIDLVNHFAEKLGKSFPEHDMDKFGETLLEPYIKMTWASFKGIDLGEDFDECNDVHIKHVISSKHHPEYWDKGSEEKLRKTSTDIDNRIVAYDMDTDSILEMCCDLCAMSKEHHNDPFNWWEDNAIGRWVFTEEQKELIFTTINKLWIGESDR